MESCFVADACELFSELSISLFGQPVTATDILTTEVQPHFGECAPHAAYRPLTSITVYVHQRCRIVDVLCTQPSHQGGELSSGTRLKDRPDAQWILFSHVTYLYIMESWQTPVLEFSGLVVIPPRRPGASLPGIVKGLEGACGLAEASLSSMSLGPRPAGSPRTARDPAQASASGCGSIGGTSAVPSSGQARQARACPMRSS